LVEYALIVGIVAVGLIGAMDVLSESAKAQFDDMGPGIAVSADGGSTPTSSTVPAPTIPAPTTTAAPTPTTVPAPTTTAAPTTTVAPTTTTTTTTAVPVPTTSFTTWGAGSSVQKGNRWQASAPLTITDDLGHPVSGATVTVEVSYRIGSTWYTEPTRPSGTTDASGALTVISGEYQRTGRNPDPVDEVRLTVVSVTGGGLTWAPGETSISVLR
jgi:Flp pilus assembly pilin Flp